MTPEHIVILQVMAILLFSYFWFFPRVAQDDLMKLTQYDLLSSVVTLIISALLFGGKEITFRFLDMEFNWFWFTIMCYIILELPLFLWYLGNIRGK